MHSGLQGVFSLKWNLGGLLGIYLESLYLKKEAVVYTYLPWYISLKHCYNFIWNVSQQTIY